MNLHKLLLVPIAAVACATAGPASAESISFSFGDLLSPASPPYADPDGGAAWAQLSVTTISATTYQFRLEVLSSFSTLFGSGAFVSEAIFNTASALDPLNSFLVASNGVNSVRLKSTAPNVGGIAFDFTDCFGTAGSCSHGGDTGRLQAGEYVTWTASFNSSQGDPFAFGDPSSALHVQAISTANGFNSAWYTPASPIPEPGTYAMLLAGLGAMGFVARRRRARLA